MKKKNIIVGAAAVAALAASPLIAQIPVTDGTVDATLIAQLTPMNTDIGIISGNVLKLMQGLIIQPTPTVSTVAATAIEGDTNATELTAQYATMLNGEMKPQSLRGKAVLAAEDGSLLADEGTTQVSGDLSPKLVDRQENTVTDIVGRMQEMHEIGQRQNMELKAAETTLSSLPDLKSVATYHAMLALQQIKATNRSISAMALLAGADLQDDLHEMREAQARQDDLKAMKLRFIAGI